jgi:hypothetical protein
LRLNIIFLVCSASVREHLVCPPSADFLGLLAAINPTAQLGEPNQTPAADSQRRQFPSGKYPVNCSAAELQMLSQTTYADECALNI